MEMSTTTSISDFKIYRRDNYYYVDKTLLIEELFIKGDQVILLPRPRRFGKTLNLSMLKYYFDIREDNKNLFKGLKIEGKELFEKYLNKYPVISLTFKDITGLTWNEDYIKLISEIKREYREHRYLLNSDKLEERDKNYFNKVLDEDNIDYSMSILELSRLLYEHHSKEVIILLDEYDTPVNKLLDDNHYKHVMNFLRNMIGITFKGNNYLFRGVITGILRIAKESIFSGANNILVKTILSNDFSDKFGFIDSEVIEIFKYNKIEDKLQEIREWYNGYKFGNDVIYNPYSIMSYIQNSEKELKGYWVNTGAENLLIKNLLINSSNKIKEKLEELIRGNNIEEAIEENIVFEQLDKPRYLWSLFLFSGYLKAIKQNKNKYILTIPNKEIKNLYVKIVEDYVEQTINNFTDMVKAILNEDIEAFKNLFVKGVKESLSYYDMGNETENTYHVFILGILQALRGKYEVISNRESGYGRYDICLIPFNKNKRGYIIEFKDAYEKDKKECAEDAIRQIENKSYGTELLSKGINNIVALGIAFKGKEVYIIHKNLSS